MLCLHNPGALVEKQIGLNIDILWEKGRRYNSDPKNIKRMQDTLQRKNTKEGGYLEARKKIDKQIWNQKQNQIKSMKSPVESPNLLSDKSTQANSNQISLVQVDLEQIKYRIQPTFLDQMEM